MCVRVGWLGQSYCLFFRSPWHGAGLDSCRKRGLVVAERRWAGRGRCGRGPEAEPALGAERGLLLVIRGFWGRGAPEKGKYLGIMEWLHNSYPVLPGQKPNLFCYSESCYSGTLACARVDSRFQMHFD